MTFVLLDYQSGIDSFIGTTLFQPILGGLISVVTIGICLLVGIPIRINNNLNIWWTQRIWLALTGVVIGLSLLILSSLPSMRETINTSIENQIVQKQIPNPVLAITGWFMTCFFLLHLFPPYNLRIWVEEKITRYTGKL